MQLKKLSEAKKYFSEFVREKGKVKIKAIYNENLHYHADENKVQHETTMYEHYLYIIFSDGKCLAIDYKDVDELSVEHREVTQEEKEMFAKNPNRWYDLFNYTHDVYYKDDVYHKISVAMEYGAIERVDIEWANDEYWKWIDGDLVEMEPTDETFSKITFYMDNGKSFWICPDGAPCDGLCELTTKDAKVDLSEYKRRAKEDE